MRRLTEVAAGVFVATSEFELTTTTVVADGAGGCLLIDPGVTLTELTRLAADLRELRLHPAVAWSTHSHWDHVLWSRDLGDPPRYATPAAAAVAKARQDEIAAEAQRSAPGHRLPLLGQLTPLDAAVIPWDGPEALLIIHDGHAPGHGAVFLPGTGVLVAGDMCSDVEIPLLDLEAPDPLGDYRNGLEWLATATGVRLVIPGHGHTGDGGEFRRRLADDATYLDTLILGKQSRDPRLGWGGPGWLQAVHDEQQRYFKPPPP